MDRGLRYFVVISAGYIVAFLSAMDYGVDRWWAGLIVFAAVWVGVSVSIWLLMRMFYDGGASKEKKESAPLLKIVTELPELDKLQEAAGAWRKQNFGEGLPHQPLLGVAEEVGELAHAHLKLEQGIRTNENLEHKRKDAAGDIVIFLLDYCNLNSLRLSECIGIAWSEASKRDWRKNKATGMADDVDG